MRRQAGFTLIELMVTVAIVAILAGIAMPSFLGQLRKSRRADAMNALGDLQLRQERWRASNIKFADEAELPGGLPASNFYTFTISGNTATGYTLQADPKGSQVKDTQCDPIELKVTATGVEKTPHICWGN